MFSLIITIISIALVAALAITAIYYMGDTTDNAGAESKAAEVMNSAAQLQGAITYYKNENVGTSPAAMQDLVDQGYLRSIPNGEWSFSDGSIDSAITIKNADQCELVNVKSTGKGDAGYGGTTDADSSGYLDPPACADVNGGGGPVVCCVDSAA